MAGTPLSDRPLIGLFTATRPPADVVAAPRLRALAAEAALQKADFMVFGSAGVEPDHAAARGIAFDHPDWVERRFPFPDVVINPFIPRSDLDLAVEEALRARVPFTTRRIANKIGIAELLKDTPLQPHVIPYEPLEAERVAEQLARFVARHQRVVVKPAKGFRGQKIMFLTATEGGVATGEVVVRSHAREYPATIDAVARTLLPLMEETPWLAQRFIASRARGDRYFDVRVHVHKDGAGELALVRAYVRLSEGGLMVSNTSRGGYQGDINHFFASLRKDAPAMVERLTTLGLDIGRTLDRHYGGETDEFGIDLLVDGARQPWVVEVNSHPQSRYHEFERARFVIAYARYLARTARPPALEMAHSSGA